MGVEAVKGFIYVIEDSAPSVYGYKIKTGTGALSAAAGSPKALGGLPADAVADSTGTNLYVTGNPAVYGFTIDGTGKLTATATPSVAASAAPRALAIDPTGQYVYAAIESLNAVNVFTRNATNGALTAVAGSRVATGSLPRDVIVLGLPQ